LCIGFWSGVVVGAVQFSITGNIVWQLPLASAGCCWIVDNLNNMVQSIEIKLDKDVANDE
jgi:hypothetical protein